MTQTLPAAAYWGTRPLADESGVSDTTVWRVWQAHGLKSHLVKSFKVSTHAQWLKFLNRIDRATPRGKTRHLVADNYATHKLPTVQKWLRKYPRSILRFTQASASWLSMVERFLHDITTECLRRGVFSSVSDSVTAIDGHIAHHNIKPEPFIWTKSARDIPQKVIRANHHFNSKKNEALHWWAMRAVRLFTERQ